MEAKKRMVWKGNRKERERNEKKTTEKIKWGLGVFKAYEEEGGEGGVGKGGREERGGEGGKRRKVCPGEENGLRLRGQEEGKEEK